MRRAERRHPEGWAGAGERGPGGSQVGKGGRPRAGSGASPERGQGVWEGAEGHGRESRRGDRAFGRGARRALTGEPGSREGVGTCSELQAEGLRGTDGGGEGGGRGLGDRKPWEG